MKHSSNHQRGDDQGRFDVLTGNNAYPAGGALHGTHQRSTASGIGVSKPEPITAQMMVIDKRRKRMTTRRRQQQKMSVTLSAGVLTMRKLATTHNNSSGGGKGSATSAPPPNDAAAVSPKYSLDIGLTVLKCNQQRGHFLIESTDAHYHLEFWPVETQDFALWKTRLNDHLFYRMRDAGRSGGGGKEATCAESATDVHSSDTTTEQQGVDIGPILDEAKKSEIQAKTMLDKSEELYKEIKAIAHEMTSLVTVFRHMTPTAIAAVRSANIGRSVTQLVSEADALSHTGMDEESDSEEERLPPPTPTRALSPSQPIVETPRRKRQVRIDVSTRADAAPASVKMGAHTPKTAASDGGKVGADESVLATPKATRTRLPATMTVGPSMGQTMKGLMRKHSSLPIGFNYPLTMLQSMCEELQQSQLLDRAATSNGTSDVTRMELVTAFVMSAYTQHPHRTRKPMTPLLGETFEYDRSADLGWRFHGEQVSKSPEALTAGHADGVRWQWWQTYAHKINILPWRGAVELTPEYYSTLRLALGAEPPHTAEHYQWNKCSWTVFNLLKPDEEQRYVSFHGDIQIRCTNGLHCQVGFVGKKGERNYKWEARITHKNNAKETLSKMHGDLCGGTFGKSDDVRPLCAAGSPPPHGRSYYSMSRFALDLNDPPVDATAASQLAPTDSRLRPDLRTFENGDVETADKLKTQQEHKQRERQRQIHAGQLPPHTPLWFVERPDTHFGNVKSWVSNNKYWQARKEKYHGYQFTNLW